MEKIAILYIIDTFAEMSGAERNLFEIVTQLDKKRYRPIVCSLEGGQLLKELEQKGIEVMELELKSILGRKAIKEAIELIKFIKKENIQIVVTSKERSDFWGGITAKLARVPVIISNRKNMGYKLSMGHLFLYKRINNRIFDAVITSSKAVKEMLIEEQRLLPAKAHTIYHGVDMERFKKIFDVNEVKKRLGLNPDNPVVGMLAGLRPIKGHRYFLTAACMVINVMPETQFLIAGRQNDPKYLLALKHFAQNLGISRNVFL